MKVVCVFISLGLLVLPGVCRAEASRASLSDGEIKRRLVELSIASTPGNCPCPYNTAANGSRCGKRSAYSRDGGYTPLCYPEDISPAMIADYRSQR